MWFKCIFVHLETRKKAGVMQVPLRSYCYVAGPVHISYKGDLNGLTQTFKMAVFPKMDFLGLWVVCYVPRTLFQTSSATFSLFFQISGSKPNCIGLLGVSIIAQWCVKSVYFSYEADYIYVIFSYTLHIIPFCHNLFFLLNLVVYLRDREVNQAWVSQ